MLDAAHPPLGRPDATVYNLYLVGFGLLSVTGNMLVYPLLVKRISQPRALTACLCVMMVHFTGCENIPLPLHHTDSVAVPSKGLRAPVSPFLFFFFFFLNLPRYAFSVHIAMFYSVAGFWGLFYYFNP